MQRGCVQAAMGAGSVKAHAAFGAIQSGVDETASQSYGAGTSDRVPRSRGEKGRGCESPTIPSL